MRRLVLILVLLLLAGCISYQHQVELPYSATPGQLTYETYRFRVTFFGMFDWYDYLSTSSYVDHKPAVLTRTNKVWAVSKEK